MKFLKAFWIGVWSVIFGVKRLWTAKERAAARKKVTVLKGAHAQMLLAARRGNVEAQRQLATRYAEGDGVEQDYTEAAHWFGQAARRGDASAQFSFGICYANGQGVGQDFEEAAEWFRRSAEQGNVGAQVSLGLCLQKGLGVFQSNEEAVAWFRRAAESGDAAGQASLASCLQTGRGVAKNDAEAVDWFLKAAAQGLAEADFNLGKCYQEGVGVPHPGLVATGASLGAALLLPRTVPNRWWYGRGALLDGLSLVGSMTTPSRWSSPAPNWGASAFECDPARATLGVLLLRLGAVPRQDRPRLRRPCPTAGGTLLEPAT